MYFTSDKGGDEAYSIHRLRLADGAIEEVATGAQLRREGPFFTADEKRFFFTARGMKESGLVLWDQPLDAAAEPPRRLVTDPRFQLSAVRKDGGQALLIEAPKDTGVWRFDLPVGKPSRLYPENGVKVLVTQVEYSSDDALAIVATDAGTEGTFLLAVDTKTGKTVRSYEERKHRGAQIQSLRVRGDRIAFVVDAGSRQELRLLDARTFSLLPSSGLPLGSEVAGALHPNATSSVALSADGKRVALQWSSPGVPSRIYLGDTSPGKLDPLQRSASAPAVEIVTKEQTVGSFDGLEIPVLVYLPAGNVLKRPVVVSVHGGFAYAATARYDAMIHLLVGEGFAIENRPISARAARPCRSGSHSSDRRPRSRT